MKVVYTAPNRAHHYRYASAMHKAGILNTFVSGFSRFSPRAKFDEIGSELHRADLLQTLYLGSLKIGLPPILSSQLAYWSKIEQDLACKRFLKDCDIFLFYNGSGLHSCQLANTKGIIKIVEAVNSHVEYQEQLLKEEYELLELPWTPFHEEEKKRRLKEYELADYILLPSDFVKDSFLSYGFQEQKLIKVPYGFNLFSAQENQTSFTGEYDDFTVLYVGSVSIRKGLRYLIEAFDKLQHPSKKLVIVGPSTDLSGLKDISIPEQVIFTGVLKGEALENAYRNASVFCLPSIEEGLALVLGEALSFGLPIIATTNTGATDIITDGQEGYIVPIRSSSSILDKLQSLADNVQLYSEMKEHAKCKAQTLHGWEETGRMLVAALSKVLTK